MGFVWALVSFLYDNNIATLFRRKNLMTKVYCSRWYEQRFSSASQSNLEFSHEIQRQKIQGVALCLEFPMRKQNFSLKNGMHTFHHINT